MQQHYQVINLHNIIKNQQTKISELKQQLRILSQREQNRFMQITENNKIVLQEKQKMLEYLKKELENFENNQIVLLNDSNNKFEKERDRFQKQIINHKKKCIELQGKYKKLENQSSLQIEELIKQNKGMNDQIKKFTQYKSNLNVQISKLNHFYKNSILEIGKRKETIVWVNKFTQYLNTCEKKQKIALGDMTDFIKSQISSLRTSLGEMVSQIVSNQQNVREVRNKIERDIYELIEKMKKQCNDILLENEKFWNAVLKSEKQEQKNQQIKTIQMKLTVMNDQQTKQIEQLKTTIKAYQTEKKTLVLGFQSCRSLNQHRETIHRQQIKQLKKTIDELIEARTERDRQFEQQLKMMTNQIENISQRYYENIEFPSRKINERISQEIEEIKQQLSKIQNNANLKNSIESLEKIMKGYLDKCNGQQNNFSLSNNVSLLKKTIEEIFLFGNQDKSMSLIFDKSTQKIFEHSDEQKQIDLREKLNKSHYEVVLAKKHLAKMKQHCQYLEKKPAQNNKKAQKDAISRRMIQLQAENQALKQNIEYIKQSQREQLQQLKQSAGSSVIQLMDKARELIIKLDRYISQQNDHIFEVKQNLRTLKLSLIKPMQSFEVLVKQMSDIHEAYASHPVSTGRQEDYKVRSTANYLSFNEEVNNYREIINKKNQNSHSMNKLFIELIKVMKESSGTKELKEKQLNCKKQEQAGKKSKQLQAKCVQKKIKEIQSQRIKHKQQILDKVQKMQQNLDKITQKTTKTNTISQALHKFETSLENKIEQIVWKTQIKFDKNQIELIKDEVINDLRLKLQESNNENQGLRKEMALYFNDNKN